MQEIHLEGRGVTSIVREDLHFFTHVRSVRLENNRIASFAAFADLPALRSLCLACNRIRAIPKLSDGFLGLQVCASGHF